MVEFHVLGPIIVNRGGEPIDIGSPRQRALLILLLLRRNRVVTTARILEDLWPNDPIGKERTLWVYISRLRTALEPNREPNAKSTVLVTRDHGYSLQVDDDALDAVRFERLVERGGRLVRDEPHAAAELISEGLALWRGAALEDVEHEEFAHAEAVRLEELRLRALEDRIDAEIHALGHRDVIGELAQLTVEHPTRERFVRLQMLALYRSGRQADALRAFERHRRHIADELGLEPSPELRRLEEQVLLHDRAIAPPESHADRTAADDLTNPFMGLRAFDDDDAPRFFGRDSLVAQTVRRIENGSRLVALVGASGSGKSSALGAGLVPAIRKGALEGSDRWLVARMAPGTAPFLELEAALARASLGEPAGLADLLDGTDDGILRVCLRMAPSDRARTLIVIDQFEELFTLGAPPELQARFVRNLETALDDTRGRVLVALGLRADFYGALLAYPRLAQHLGDGIVNVVPLTLDELEAAAERPAAQAGVGVEPPLLGQLLADVAGETGGLPLFQYALTELFDRRRERTLTLADYRAMGGVSGALSRRAEDLFRQFAASESAVAEQVLLRMVTVTDRRVWARRRVTATELLELELDLDLVALQGVLQRLGDHRLVTFDRDPLTGSPTVQVAHEALLTEWPRLREWIELGEDDVMQHDRLAAARAEWIAADEHKDYLLTGERLKDYERWAATTVVQPTAAERSFLDRSVAHREQRRAVEHRRDDENARLSRQTRRLWVVAAAAMIAMVVTAIVIVVPGGSPPRIAVIQGPAAGDASVARMIVSGRRSAERTHGIEIDLEPTLVEPEVHLRNVAESGADLIIVPKEYDLELGRVVHDHPDVHWVALDPVVLHTEAPNLTEIHFDVEDSAFLAGAAAAWRSSTNRVGFIGGLQSFRTERSRNGFERGARFENPTIEVESTYLGPVPDPLVEAEQSDELAHELAIAMFGRGADVIFHDAGEAGLGVIRAAAEIESRGRQVWAIGSNVDQHQTVTNDEVSVVLTSTVKHFDTAVVAAIDRFLSGDLEAGELALGIGDAGVALSDSGGQLDGIAGHLQNLEDEIAAEHLSVSRHASRAPDWQSDPQLVIRLALTDDGCRLVDATDRPSTDGTLLAGRADHIVVELANESGDVAGIALRQVAPGTTLEQLRIEARDGIPPSFESTLGISRAHLGGATSSAAVIGSDPIAVNCFDSRRDHVVLIVRPT